MSLNDTVCYGLKFKVSPKGDAVHTEAKGEFGVLKSVENWSLCVNGDRYQESKIFKRNSLGRKTNILSVEFKFFKNTSAFNSECWNS